MLILLAYLTLTKIVSSQNILGVSYSFDTDFERTFNGNNCDDKDMWYLVEYGSIGVEAPYASDRAIRGLSNSCASSFPIILIPGSTLDLCVYVNSISKDSGVEVIVFNEGDKPVARYIYNKFSRDFVAGWCEISLPINASGVGYIKLIGHSRDSEIVLIDSFRYKPNQTKIDNKKDDDSNTLIFNVHKENTVTELEEDEAEESSGDHEYENELDNGSGEESAEEIVDDSIHNPTVNTASLGPWAIALISVGVFTVLGLLIVSAYHVGKNRGMAQSPLIHIDEIAPRRLPIIPRVRRAESVTLNERIRSF